MTQEESRKEVLELLARGKINIDEAVALLDQSSPVGTDAKGKKTEAAGQQPLKVEVTKDIAISKDTDLVIEDIPLPDAGSAKRNLRWLRIYVGDLETGKSKVRVNVPFGMVKFGLGMAKMFAPQEYSGNLDQIDTMLAEADSGLLVDVQDVESNDHVRIFVE